MLVRVTDKSLLLEQVMTKQDMGGVVSLKAATPLGNRSSPWITICSLLQHPLVTGV